MRTIVFIIASFFLCRNLLSQNDSVLKFIFVPHPRSIDRSNQSVLGEIEKIDFSTYDMILLGGDLTYYTSISRVSMDYCDNLFNLKSLNTLWTMGNHDLNNLSLIHEYTGRNTFYAYFRDKISFVVLDTEHDASGFESTFIKNEQLQMLTEVCDTLEESEFLILLHHRLIWMIGNTDFSDRIDSVGESTKQLDTTNFYQEVYPLLKKVKSKGKQVICLGGDKSFINIEYSPEDSITFLTSTIAPDYTDSINKVIILTYRLDTHVLSWEFVSPDKLWKVQPNKVPDSEDTENNAGFRIYQELGSDEISMELTDSNYDNAIVRVFSITGKLQLSFEAIPNEKSTFRVENKGIYLLQIIFPNSMKINKILVL